MNEGARTSTVGFNRFSVSRSLDGKPNDRKQLINNEEGSTKVTFAYYISASVYRINAFY